MDSDFNLPGVFQHWQFAPAPQPGGEISFEAAAAQAEAVSLWSLDLPADPKQAGAALAQVEAQLQATQALLDQAPARLENLVASLQSGSVAQFGLGPTSPESLPVEATLLPWIDAFEPGRVSFGGEGLTRGEVKDALDQLQRLVDNLLGQLLHLARVETRQQGDLLASTLVSWKGDMDTTWGVGITPDQNALHRRSLALALRARIGLLRILMTTTQGAVKISALIAAPGGALLALPAAWKYITKLLSEIESYQATPG